jgi:hypothetical protein
MNYRWYEYLSGLSITTAGTESINLKGDDPISALMIQVRLTGATGTPSAPADQAITRIKVVDGSEVLYNGRGIVGVPLGFNVLGQEPVHFNAYQNLIENIATFIIPFGRYLRDPEYAFDPSKYKNPKIEIEHAYTNGGLGTPSAATIQLYALMFDEKIPSLRGFLKTKEVYSYTLTNSNVTTVELPVDLPIRALMVQSYAKGKSMNDQINSIKLSEDNDKHIVFDESVSNLVKLVFPQKPFVENMLGETNSTTQRLHYGYNCYESYMTPVSTLVATDIYSIVAYGPNIDVRSTTTCEFTGRRVGYCPNGMIFMPMGIQSDPMDWLKPRPDMDLDLKLTCGSSVLASSTAQVLVQQEQRY